MEDLWKFDQADMTQSGKHGIFDGIPGSLRKSSIDTSCSSVNFPNGRIIILCQFEEPKMTQSGKHGIFHGTFVGFFQKS